MSLATYRHPMRCPVLRGALRDAHGTELAYVATRGLHFLSSGALLSLSLSPSLPLPLPPSLPSSLPPSLSAPISASHPLLLSLPFFSYGLAMCLRASYAMCGTKLAYGALGGWRSGLRFDPSASVWPYQPPMSCPCTDVAHGASVWYRVPTRMLGDPQYLPTGCYAMSGTEVGQVCGSTETGVVHGTERGSGGTTEVLAHATPGPSTPGHHTLSQYRTPCSHALTQYCTLVAIPFLPPACRPIAS
eukprot:719005-Rhodomonas_salina.1